MSKVDEHLQHDCFTVAASLFIHNKWVVLTPMNCGLPSHLIHGAALASHPWGCLRISPVGLPSHPTLGAALASHPWGCPRISPVGLYSYLSRWSSMVRCSRMPNSSLTVSRLWPSRHASICVMAAASHRTAVWQAEVAPACKELLL